jgi:uncharacterized protein (DUF1778 family)
LTDDHQRSQCRTSSSGCRALRAAAAATDQSLADFVISSAEARAEEVLASRTPVPAGYFEQLIAALDAPAISSNPLRTLARRPRRMK